MSIRFVVVGPPRDRPLSAIPSRRARALAFVAILVAGGSGALIGASFVGLQCEGTCTTATGLAAVISGLVAAGGVAVVAVLVLRAMGEWRRLEAPPGFDDGVGGGSGDGPGGEPPVGPLEDVPGGGQAEPAPPGDLSR